MFNKFLRYKKAEDKALEALELGNKMFEQFQDSQVKLEKLKVKIEDIKKQNIIISDGSLKLQDIEDALANGDDDETNDLIVQANEYLDDVQDRYNSAIGYIQDVKKLIASQKDTDCNLVNEINEFYGIRKLLNNGDYKKSNKLLNKQEILKTDYPIAASCGVFAGFLNGFLVIPRWSLQATEY